MRTGIFTPISNLAFAILLSLPIVAIASNESFDTFLIHFIQDRSFAATRIRAPLPVLLDPSEIPRPQARWSVEEAMRKMTWPLSKEQLANREEKLKIRGDTITLSQYDTETDGYAFEYVFQRKDGQWFLVEFVSDVPG
jgi:hypothetical protein